MEKKILVAEMKDDDGVKIITALTHQVYWKDIESMVRNETIEGRSATVRFYERTQKWIDALPEYQG